MFWSLGEAKFKGDRLAEGIPRQHNIQTLPWVLLATSNNTQCENLKQKPEQKIFKSLACAEKKQF